jgi:hypothetical protein
MRYAFALLLYGVFVVANLGASSIPAFNVSGGTIDFTEFTYTIGDQFTTNQTIDVTDLGVYSISDL